MKKISCKPCEFGVSQTLFCETGNINDRGDDVLAHTIIMYVIQRGKIVHSLIFHT